MPLPRPLRKGTLEQHKADAPVSGTPVRVLPLMFKSLAAQGRNFSGSLYKNACVTSNVSAPPSAVR